MNITDHVQLLLDNAALLRGLGRLHNNELMKSSLEAVIKEAEIIVALMDEEETKETEELIMSLGLVEEPTQPKKPAA